LNLFRRSLQTEPEPKPEPEQQPDALALAITEEAASAKLVREASYRCTALDAEQKSWSARRDQAYRDFCESLKRHADAKKKIADISKPEEAVK